MRPHRTREKLGYWTGAVSPEGVLPHSHKREVFFLAATAISPAMWGHGGFTKHVRLLPFTQHSTNYSSKVKRFCLAFMEQASLPAEGMIAACPIKEALHFLYRITLVRFFFVLQVCVSCSSPHPGSQHVSILFLTVVQDTAEGMLRGQFEVWIASTVLVTALLGWNTAVVALPHQVVPVPATTDALSLALYVKSSEMCQNACAYE